MLPEEYFQPDDVTLPTSGYFEADEGVAPTVTREGIIDLSDARRPRRDLSVETLIEMTEEEREFERKRIENIRKIRAIQEKEKRRLRKDWELIANAWDWVSFYERSPVLELSCNRCERGENLYYSGVTSVLEMYRRLASQQTLDAVIIFANKHKNCIGPERQELEEYHPEIAERQDVVTRALKDSGIDFNRVYANGVTARVMCKLCKEWDKFPEEAEDKIYLEWIRDFQRKHEACEEG